MAAPGQGILAGKKTYVTAALAIFGAIGAYLLGETDPGTTMNVIVSSLLAVFIRNGIANSGGSK